MTNDSASQEKPLYLNIIWHQHQPLYLDPASDQLQGPWVRTHATKDYYDMTAMLEKYPSIHFTVNLTSSLLYQLQEYYVNRLGPFVDTKKNSVDAPAFLAAYRGKTDPWIDIALMRTEDLNEQQRAFLLTNVWNAFGASEVMMGRFPAYAELRGKSRETKGRGLSIQEQREVKFWFYLAHFDPDFLEGKVRLTTGHSVDVTDLVRKEQDGTYSLVRPVTEADCNRMVAETYKICAAIVPLHKRLMYHPKSNKGQLEIITTPFYHPILPLIFDSDLSKVCQPNDPAPSRFNYPEDADAQVAKAVEYFRETFGSYPTGMWPAEGSVAHDILPVFERHGISWIATDEKILSRSRPEGRPAYYPYAIQPLNGKRPVVAVFRETELSDKIGFVYQNFRGEEAAEDFIRSILRYVPKNGESDRLLTVILDGENAWEWYRHDNDGKEFQNALYQKLTDLQDAKRVITATVTEYIQGNAKRDIPAHPAESLPALEWLWPGSWINMNYDTWIGEDEENRAWEMLRITREDLGASGLEAPNPKAEKPKKESKAWYSAKAWDAMYAAEGSDWFWWYGTDQTAPAGDKPFDEAFITLIRNVYDFARKAGASMPNRVIRPIIGHEQAAPSTAGGTMAQSASDMVLVRFTVRAVDMYVRKSLYIAGDYASLGDWKPNVIRLFDDGTNGDEKAGDNTWSLEVLLPAGAHVEYKYTNSGPVGEWQPGEEFPVRNRSVDIPHDAGKRFEINDTFGLL